MSGAIERLAEGYSVVIVDPVNAPEEGELVFAAERATAAHVAFMVRHTAGFVRTAITAETAARLCLPPMAYVHANGAGSAFTVTVDASEATSTGISARDRARTIRVLADPVAGPDELTRPGHIVPVRVRDGGVLACPGRAEAAVDLVRLAGAGTAAALCPIVSESRPVRLAMPQELRAFCDRHGLVLVTVQDVVARLSCSGERIAKAAS
ncbi:3,4-dihydroxy-2-butanone-4-phosphate synthase [Tamaricihabitans halophyticus]|uniref:3,4-dihydroxy-2-butanone-4-phosphate synthase n=1 Tax=Tamaricihabitans halophyticus TaxID=1262583 RepID=UPI0014050623|nr:3,4-dihydroxy-2-butanone-4-phosphate synthase [Tamaricihabitans halophyticus]